MAKQTTPTALTPEQLLTLIEHAYSWLASALVVTPTYPRIGTEEAPGVEAMDQFGRVVSSMRPHMMVLAFNHADECLRLSRNFWPGDFPAAEADAFRSSWGPLQDLRDALEHEEDYLAGVGWRPGDLLGESKVSIRSHGGAMVPMYGVMSHFDGDDEHANLLKLTVLGVEYDVRPVIGAASILTPELGRFIEA